MKIEGMRCGMCETHINDLVRKNFKVKKVSSYHQKNETIILTKEPIDEQALKDVITYTGYKVLSIYTEEYEKKRFFFK